MLKRYQKALAWLLIVLMITTMLPQSISQRIGMSHEVSAATSITYTAREGSETSMDSRIECLIDDSYTPWEIYFKYRDSDPYVIFETSRAIQVTSYSIISAYSLDHKNTYSPKAWALYGCNDYTGNGNGTWTKIDEVKNDEILKSETYKEFVYTPPKTSASYKYFKFVVTDNWGGRNMMIKQLKLSDCVHNYERTGEKKSYSCGEHAYIEYTCSDCGLVKRDYTVAPGHQYDVNGVCTKCRLLKPSEPKVVNKVYQISNANELYWYAALVNGTDGEAGYGFASACLTNDIVINQNLLKADGSLNTGTFIEWRPIGFNTYGFNGELDAQGHTISGLYCNMPEQDYVGFISEADSMPTKVNDLGIVDSYVCGANGVGSICGEIENSYTKKCTLTNCYSNATVKGKENVGGLIGYVEEMTAVSNNHFDGKVEGDTAVGGILGFAAAVEMENCYNTGTVKGTTNVGGVAGSIPRWQKGPGIVSCYNTGAVTGQSNVGGLVGDTSKGAFSITSSHNTGVVTGQNNVGGLIGNLVGDCTNSYNSGTVKVTGNGSNVGGLVGYNKLGEIYNCYNDGNIDVSKATSTADTIGGLVGYNNLYMRNVYVNIDTCTYSNPRIGVNNAESKSSDRIQRKYSSAFTSGEVAYELSKGSDDCSGDVWEQNLGAGETKPTPGDGTYRVYFTSNTYHNHDKAYCRICQEEINPPEKDENGTYQLSKLSELNWFAQYVNETDSSANAVLTADITVNADVLKSDGTLADNTADFTLWTPIGSESRPYTGTFDGQGHTIKGLYYNNTGISSVGLFGKISAGAKICNVGVADSYFRGKSNVGAICGSNNGLIQSCYAAAPVQGTQTGIGPICGINNGTTQVCYYLADSETDSIDGTTYKQKAAFANGEVTYLLNGEQSSLVWGQTLNSSGADAMPVAIREDGTNRVYKGTSYHNHGSGITSCEYCKAVIFRQPAKNGDVYQISSLEELYWFADRVNTGQTGLHAVLTADITDNSGMFKEDGGLDTNNSGSFRIWTPIGNETNPFAGTFDGQGHRIQGLYCNSAGASYAGLFGKVAAEGIIANTGLTDSYFSAKEYVGGLAGSNAGTLYGCFFDGTVKAAGNYGGIYGMNTGTVTDSCYMAGSATDSASDVSLAKTKEQFESGEVTYLLNGRRTDIVWGQTLTGEQADVYPVKLNENKTNRVYSGTTYHNHSIDMTSCDNCRMYIPKEPAQQSGIYQIGTVNELCWLAEQVNTGNTDVKAVLTADIIINETVLQQNGSLNPAAMKWVPAGTQDHPFAGTLDGNGYAVCGLYVDGTDVKTAGLFGKTASGAEISNLGVVDSYITGAVTAGAVCAENAGTIKNSYVIAAAGNSGNAETVCGTNTGTITGCYYQASAEQDAVAGTTFKTKEQFEKGEVTYLLNGDQSVIQWTQNLSGTSAQTRPVHADGVEEHIVYYSSGTYHNHADGYCKYCKTYAAKEPAKAGDVYQIHTVNELYWFAGLINGTLTGVERQGDAKAELMEDICVNENLSASLKMDADGNVTNASSFVTWNPIGAFNIYFKGSFDGNGHVIRGLFCGDKTKSSTGLFGDMSGGTIQNIAIEDSYFTGEKYVGAVCGYNRGTIRNCYSSAVVKGDSSVGGICGIMSEYGSVTDCYNNGPVSGRRNIGGLCGWNNYGTLKGSCQTGKVEGQEQTGAVCGYTSSTKNGESVKTGTIEACWYVKDVNAYKAVNNKDTDGAKGLSILEMTDAAALQTMNLSADIWSVKDNNLAEKTLYYPMPAVFKNGNPSVTYDAVLAVTGEGVTPAYLDTIRLNITADFKFANEEKPVSVVNQLAWNDFDITISNQNIGTVTIKNNPGTDTYDLMLAGEKIATAELRNSEKGGKDIYYGDTYIGRIYGTDSGVTVEIEKNVPAGCYNIGITYKGTDNLLLNGIQASYELNIARRIVKKVDNPTLLNVIRYGQTLADYILDTAAWSWTDSSVLPAVTDHGYTAVRQIYDYLNYDYSQIAGYNETDHTIVRELEISVNKTTPVIRVTPDAAEAVILKQVRVAADAVNPYNASLKDVPDVVLTYRIGDGEEQPMTDASFVIPKDTAAGTVIRVTARTAETDNYNAASAEAVIIAQACAHENRTCEHDAQGHWFVCEYCGDITDRAAHVSEGPATALKAEVCSVCGYEMSPKLLPDNPVENITSDNVIPADREGLESTLDMLKKNLEAYGGQYTDEEKQMIEESIRQIEEALAVLDHVKTVEERIAALPETVRAEDEETISAIKEIKAAYEGLTDYEKSLLDAACKQKLDALVKAVEDVKPDERKFMLDDAQICLKAALRIIPETYELIKTYDMDNDEKLTLSDVQIVLKKALRIM